MSAPAPVVLRRKAPYTCRQDIGGKPCAAILREDDDKLCQRCAAGLHESAAAFAAWLAKPLPPVPVEPEAESETPEERAARRARWPFWPGAEDAPCMACDGYDAAHGEGCPLGVQQQREEASNQNHLAKLY